jgi:hypothetical protein
VYHVAENTGYTYQLIFQTGSGASLVSLPTVAYTLAAVDSLQAQAVTDSVINVSWNSNAPDATGFELQQSIDSGATWTTLTTSADTIPYPVTGLSADQDYTFQVCALRPDGNSQFTAPADAYTLPDAPSSLTATANGTNEIDLSWPEDDSNVYGYDLQRSDDNGTTFTSIAQLDPGTTSYTDTDVLDGTEYQYQILSDNSSGESNPSQVASATTDMAIPTELVATSLDGSGVQLAWVNNSQSATDFDVQRSTDGENFSDVSLDDNGIDSSTQPGTQYYYQVIAQNAAASSAPSSVASAVATPTISISSATDGVNVGDTYTLNVTIQRDMSLPDPITSLSIDWGDGNTQTPGADSGAFTHVYTQPGDFTVVATAQTAAGPIQDMTGVAVTAPTYTPSLSVGISDSSIAQGSSVTLTPTLSGLPPGATVSQWVVDWGDGSTDGSFTHTYPHGMYGGIGYSITVAAVTSDGVVSAATGVSVTAPPTDTSVYVTPDPNSPSAAEGQPVIIDAYTSGITPAPSNFTIDFGDGTTGQASGGGTPLSLARVGFSSEPMAGTRAIPDDGRL